MINQLIDNNDLTRIINPQYHDGILLVDGKYIPVKKLNDDTKYSKINGFIPKSRKRGKTKGGLVVMPFMDYKTHDIPVCIIASSENMFDIAEGFKKLKEIKYDLKVIVCDESMGEIAQVAKRFYPNVIIQTCLLHYVKNINREFRIDGIKRTMKKLERQLAKIGDSIFIPTRHLDIKKALEITNTLADLEFEYDYLIGFQSIFNQIFWKVETKKQLMEAEKRLNFFINKIDFKAYQHSTRIKRRYNDYYKKIDKLTAFIKYSELDIPKTTNLIEGFNSTTLELRLTSIRGFEKEETARKYVNALILKYRFHKFTDCKGKFKNLNGKSPLEITEPLNQLKFNFHTNNWIKFCKKLHTKYGPKN